MKYCTLISILIKKLISCWCTSQELGPTGRSWLHSYIVLAEWRLPSELIELSPCKFCFTSQIFSNNSQYMYMPFSESLKRLQARLEYSREIWADINKSVGHLQRGQTPKNSFKALNTTRQYHQIIRDAKLQSTSKHDSVIIHYFLIYSDLILDIQLYNSQLPSGIN